LSQHTVHISTVIKVSGFQTTSCAKLIGKKRQLADVDNSSVLAIAENFKRGEWKAVDIVMEYLQRIHEMDKVLSAFLSVDAERLVVVPSIFARAHSVLLMLLLCGRALYKAQLLDEKWDKGEHLGPLAAVPVAIKDNLCTKGMVTTAGSKMLETFVPAYDATSVARLEAAVSSSRNCVHPCFFDPTVRVPSSWEKPTWMSLEWVLLRSFQVSIPVRIPGILVEFVEVLLEALPEQFLQGWRLLHLAQTLVVLFVNQLPFVAYLD